MRARGEIGSSYGERKETASGGIASERERLLVTSLRKLLLAVVMNAMAGAVGGYAWVGGFGSRKDRVLWV